MVRHISYTVQPRDPCSGAAVGDPQAFTDPPCDGSCDTSAGPGIYATTRLLHLDTCTRDAPVCTKASPCPDSGCL